MLKSSRRAWKVYFATIWGTVKSTEAQVASHDPCIEHLLSCLRQMSACNLEQRYKHMGVHSNNMCMFFLNLRLNVHTSSVDSVPPTSYCLLIKPDLFSTEMTQVQIRTASSWNHSTMLFMNGERCHRACLKVHDRKQFSLSRARALSHRGSGHTRQKNKNGRTRANVKLWNSIYRISLSYLAFPFGVRAIAFCRSSNIGRSLLVFFGP